MNQTSEQNYDLENIVELANALSLLDCEVKGGKSALNSAGARLSKESCKADKLVIQLLQGRSEPLRRLLPQNPGLASLDRKNPKFLHVFLSEALNQVIKVGVGVKEVGQGAGAIYLHNWQHDELVMAACTGFPLRKPKWQTELIEYLKGTQSLTEPLNREKNNILRDLPLNLGRLNHIATKLGPQVRRTTIARHPWVHEELRGVYRLPQEENVDQLDCNKALIGVAYYKPGRGITGRLFHPEQGPKLERPAFAEIDNFDSEFRECLDSAGLENSLIRHLQAKLLRQCTVVYSQRDEMAAGREVKAGLYEGMQFPGSPFIGPFMGTVLRFNGERLGILKIEKHKFNANRTINGWLATVRSFNEQDTAKFLVFAYALAGVLYVFKHHAGFDLTTAWTSA